MRGAPPRRSPQYAPRQVGPHSPACGKARFHYVKFVEIIMRPSYADIGGDGSLRLVFKDSVVSYRLSSDPITFGEIAGTLDRIPFERHGDLVAIDVILGKRLPE